jgi:hypothetical protein
MAVFFFDPGFSSCKGGNTNQTLTSKGDQIGVNRTSDTAN